MDEFGKVFIFNVGQGACIFKVKTEQKEAYIIDFGSKKLPENVRSGKQLKNHHQFFININLFSLHICFFKR